MIPVGLWLTFVTIGVLLMILDAAVFHTDWVGSIGVALIAVGVVLLVVAAV